MDNIDMPSRQPSRKVVGATAGAGLGGVTANLIVWGLDDLVFDPAIPDNVPGAVSAFVVTVVPLALSFVGGYLTRRNAGEVVS